METCSMENLKIEYLRKEAIDFLKTSRSQVEEINFDIVEDTMGDPL